jgi:hypothetical protein
MPRAKSEIELVLHRSDFPTLAQASSASPPGAPDTPTVTPPASTRTPPLRITAPGRLRRTACGMPGWLILTSLVVSFRKLIAVQPLPAAGSCRRHFRTIEDGSSAARH